MEGVKLRQEHESLISSNKKKGRYKSKYGNQSLKISVLISLSFQRSREQDHELRGDSVGNLRTGKV